MTKVIVVLSVLFVSAQSQAGVVCGEFQRYGSSYVQVSCAEGYACVDISGKTYKFDEKKTSEKALDDLYFAAQEAFQLRRQRVDANICIITNDNDGSLKTATTHRLREA